MATVTGIEIGPDSCVLVAVRPRRGGPIEVRSFEAVERAAWPSHDTAVAAALASIRRARKLPRTARVVAWSLPDGAGLKEPLAVAALRPLTEAGFRVETVLSPVQALARLAASRPRDGATAWLALNVYGAAIAIVRGRELLFERTFGWTYDANLNGNRAQLLQRYSLVAQLAPELRRGLSDVRLFHGVSVATVITCGDLPELRSLTMPLIEELDLEVETLDSTDGLEPVGQARLDRFAESAPALRLACAAATTAPVARGLFAGQGVRAAAAAAIVAAVVLGALALRNDGSQEAPAAPAAATRSRGGRTVPAPAPGASSAPVASRPSAPVPSVPAPTAPAATATVGHPSLPASGLPPAAATSPAPPPASTAAARPSLPVNTPPTAPAGGQAPSSAPVSRPTLPPPASSAAAPSPGPRSTLPSTGPLSAPVKPPPPLPSSSSAALPLPGARSTPPPAGPPTAPGKTPAPPPSSSSAALPLPGARSTPPPAGPRSAPVKPPPPSSSSAGAPAASARPSLPAAGGPVSTPPAPQVASDSKPGAPTGGSNPAALHGAGRARTDQPLKDPLPVLDSVLIDQDRRLAIVDGGVAAVGDRVASRVLIAVNRDGIVLREPSGLEVRVPLRLSVGRPN